MSPAKRTPDVVKIAGESFPITSLEQASDIWARVRDEYELAGSSDVNGATASFGGKRYRISYNGRVWDAATGAEVSLSGQKTCAQLDKEGWADVSRPGAIDVQAKQVSEQAAALVATLLEVSDLRADRHNLPALRRTLRNLDSNGYETLDDGDLENPEVLRAAIARVRDEGASDDIVETSRGGKTAITCVYLGGESPSRYSSVCRRLKAAGHSVMGGAGYGAYGTEMVLTSATESEAKSTLDGVSFASSITYGKPVRPVKIT